MDQPFTHTLSFADLEVLVLAEDGGATPRELVDSLGFDLEEARALVYDLVRRGLLIGEHESTAFQLTPWLASCGTMQAAAMPPSRLRSRGASDPSRAARSDPLLLPGSMRIQGCLGRGPC